MVINRAKSFSCHVGWERDSGGLPRPCPKGRGPSVPQNFGPPTCASIIKFCMAIKPREENFYAVDHEC